MGQLSSMSQSTPPPRRREHWLGHWVRKPGQCKEMPWNTEYWTRCGVVVIKAQTVVTRPVQSPHKTKWDKIPARVGRCSGDPTPIWRLLATAGTVVTRNPVNSHTYTYTGTAIWAQRVISKRSQRGSGLCCMCIHVDCPEVEGKTKRCIWSNTQK